MAARAAASVVWLTAGGALGAGAGAGALGARTSALSALSALTDALVGFAATLGSGFLIGTGAFDVTTTSFTMV